MQTFYFTCGGAEDTTGFEPPPEECPHCGAPTEFVVDWV